MVTPPAGFEVSTDNFNFSNAVTVGQPGTVASITVYIRLAAATAAGNYTGNIVLSSASASSVNILMPVSAVSPANLTVTADNKSKMQGQVNPVLTATYKGFKNNDAPAQLTAKPVIITTAVTASPVGQYPISVSGAASANYTFTYIAGILTIIPAPQIPNTFTPNGDGVNDVWNIKSLSDYPECTVAIYSRYGSLIYQSTGYPAPWDGTINGGAVPVGTYYYIINLQNGSNQLTGSVTVIR